MTVTIGSHEFSGPHTAIHEIDDQAGIFIMVSKEGDSIFPIDVDQSNAILTSIRNHERKDCWKENCTGNLAVLVYYTPGMASGGRQAIEQEIRNENFIPCG